MVHLDGHRRVHLLDFASVAGKYEWGAPSAQNGDRP
jgi:hypothetical protein